MLRGGFGINYNQNEIAITSNGVGNPPNAVQASYTCPFPYTNNTTCADTGILYQTANNVHSIFGYAPNPNAITQFGPDNLPLTGVASVTGFPANPKTIANYHWSLDTQYQLPYNLVMSLGYQGNVTRHVLIHNNWNAIGAAQDLALNPKVNFLNFWENSGSANFNAMIASLKHDFSHNFQAQAIYTWAKAQVFYLFSTVGPGLLDR